MTEKTLSERLVEESTLALWIGYCEYKESFRSLRDLLREVRGAVDTVASGTFPGDHLTILENVRDRIDVALAWAEDTTTVMTTERP